MRCKYCNRELKSMIDICMCSQKFRVKWNNNPGKNQNKNNQVDKRAKKISMIKGINF